MYRSIRTDTAARFDERYGDRVIRGDEPTRYVLSVPGENADRTFDNWQTATRYAASAAARLRSAGRTDDAYGVTISEA